MTPSQAQLGTKIRPKLKWIVSALLTLACGQLLAASPVVTDDAETVSEDASLTTITVLDNDTDADVGETLSLSNVLTTGSGTVGINSDGVRVDYTPANNFDGPETLYYIVTDTTGNTSAGRLVVTVTAVNDAPVAVDDTETILEDAALTNITVLDDDTDADGDSLTLSSVSLDDSSLGTVAINADNTTIDFTPAADANGTATVTYTVSDGTTTDTGDLVITITAVDDGPTAVNDAATTGANSTLIINVTANDIEPDGTALTITAISTPSNGTVTTDGATITYVPSTDFSGTDSFSYEISDVVSADSATVTVTVLKENVGACDPSAADLSTLTDGCKVSPTGYKTSVYSFGLCSSPPTAPETGYPAPDPRPRYTPTSPPPITGGQYTRTPSFHTA